jgi:hypothetical protein
MFTANAHICRTKKIPSGLSVFENMRPPNWRDSRELALPLVSHVVVCVFQHLTFPQPSLRRVKAIIAKLLPLKLLPPMLLPLKLLLRLVLLLLPVSDRLSAGVTITCIGGTPLPLCSA